MEAYLCHSSNSLRLRSVTRRPNLQSPFKFTPKTFKELRSLNLTQCGVKFLRTDLASPSLWRCFVHFSRPVEERVISRLFPQSYKHQIIKPSLPLNQTLSATQFSQVSLFFLRQRNMIHHCRKHDSAALESGGRMLHTTASGDLYNDIAT